MAARSGRRAFFSARRGFSSPVGTIAAGSTSLTLGAGASGWAALGDMSKERDGKCHVPIPSTYQLLQPFFNPTIAAAFTAAAIVDRCIVENPKVRKLHTLRALVDTKAGAEDNYTRGSSDHVVAHGRHSLHKNALRHAERAIALSAADADARSYARRRPRR